MFTSGRLATVVLAGVGLLVLHPVLRTGFVLVDDHEILSFSPLVHADPQLRPLPELVAQIAADADGGRFRPLYWVIRYAEAATLDEDAQAWHALYLALGVLAAAVLYQALTTAGIGGLPALLTGCWLLVQPWVSSVWIGLGPQESLGTVLLVLGALATTRGAAPGASRGWDAVFVVVVSAATLVKESFALVPPAMLVLRMLLFAVRKGRLAAVERRAVGVGLVPVAIGLAVSIAAASIAARSQAGSYGGSFLGAAAVSVDAPTVANLIVLGLAGGVGIPFLFAGLALELRSSRRLTAGSVAWLIGAGAACLLILPQMVIYRRYGFAMGRYLLPAGLALAAATAAGTVWSHRRGQSWIAVIVTSIWMTVVGLGAVGTWRQADLVRADSLELARLVDALDRLPPGSKIAIAADPARRQEEAISLPYHLAAHGRPDLEAWVLMTDLDNPNSAKAADELRTLFFPGRVDAAASSCSDFAAVVLLSSEADAQRALPCLSGSGFRLQSFSETSGELIGWPSLIRDLFPPVDVTYSALFK